jgi:hypothetical protein
MEDLHDALSTDYKTVVTLKMGRKKATRETSAPNQISTVR